MLTEELSFDSKPMSFNLTEKLQGSLTIDDKYKDAKAKHVISNIEHIDNKRYNKRKQNGPRVRHITKVNQIEYRK